MVATDLYGQAFNSKHVSDTAQPTPVKCLPELIHPPFLIRSPVSP